MDRSDLFISILKVVGFLGGMVIGCLLACIKQPDLPRNIRRAGWLELAFSVCLAMPGILSFKVFKVSILADLAALFPLIFIIMTLIGFLWAALSIRMMTGSHTARKLIYFFAILRGFSIVGLVFSIPTIMLLKKKDSTF